jgi:hypothetical protein
MEGRIPTTELIKMLRRATVNLSNFIKQHTGQVRREPFHKYLTKLCITRGVKQSTVINRGDLSSIGPQLFTGYRRPSRDTVIRLAFGFEMDYDDTQALLYAANKNQLYPRIERDAAIIFALSRKMKITRFQDLLDEYKLPKLGEGEK